MGWPRPVHGGVGGAPPAVVPPPAATRSLWSSFAEIHATELGVLLGLIVVVVYWNRPRAAYALLFFGVFLAFGSPEVAEGPIHRKPWYFLLGVYAPTIIGIAIVEWARGGTETERTDEAGAAPDRDDLPDPAETEFEFPATGDSEFEFPDGRGDR